MNEHQQPSPEDQARIQEAGRLEAEQANVVTTQYLQSRVVELRAEVMRLEAEVTALEARQGDQRHDAANDGSGDRPQ